MSKNKNFDNGKKETQLQRQLRKCLVPFVAVGPLESVNYASLSRVEPFHLKVGRVRKVRS
jgi:hypothetical protein